MGIAKMSTVSGLKRVKNSVEKMSFGSTDIDANTFVQIVSNGGGMLLLGSLTDVSFSQVSMLTGNKICALRISGDSSYFRVGTIGESAITFGTEVYSYLATAFYPMVDGAKILDICMEDSGYSRFTLWKVSGSTLTSASEVSDPTKITGPEGFGCFKISESQAIAWESGYNGGYLCNLHLLTISGDTLKSVNFNLYNEYTECNTVNIKGCVISNGYIVLIEERSCSESPYRRTYMHLLSVSGDTLSLKSSTQIASSAWYFLSDLKQIVDGTAVGLVTTGGSTASTVNLMKIKLSGTALSRQNLSLGISGFGSSYPFPVMSFDLLVSNPYIYVIKGNGSTFNFVDLELSNDTLSVINTLSTSYGTAVYTNTGGNALLSNGVPIIAVKEKPYNAGVIRNYGRYEVKISETKIDGLSATKLSSEKAGKIWMLS